MELGGSGKSFDYGPTEKKYKSLLVAQVTIPAFAGTQALPDIVVPAFTGFKVIEAWVNLVFRKVVNDGVGSSAIFGDQLMQIRKGGAGAWTDCLNLTDNIMSTPATSEGPGDAYFGSINVAALITAADTYNFQLLLAVADLALVLHDVQVIIVLVLKPA